MLDRILEELEILRPEMIRTLAASIRIKSVQDEPVQTADAFLPFGKGVEEAYQHMLKVGKDLGFEVSDFDHYGGHIEWKSTKSKDKGDAKVFGIIGHLDVVPEGTGWDSDPYGAAVVDGCMIGRGTTDDKGPLVAALFAMKALKDAGCEPVMDIRLILGLDEETGMKGVDRYIEMAGEPDLGITPDADFPLIYGEKGRVEFDLAQKLPRQIVKDGIVLRRIEGGTAANAVPATAKAIIASEDKKYYDLIRNKADAFTRETGYKLSVRKAGTSLAVEAVGKAAHGATPELGLNAVSILMEFLGTIEFACEEVNDYIAFYNRYIGFNVHGEGLGCDLTDEPSGRLSFNVGVAECSEEIASVTVDIRYPVTYSEADVYAGIEKVLADSNVGLIKKSNANPVYLDVNDPFVNSLMEAYREETGDMESEPMVIGGGTYSKHFKRMLAFGAQFPGDEDRMHQANEAINLDQLHKAARIYARMLYKICC